MRRARMTRYRRRPFRRSPYEMQQLSMCRSSIELDISNEHFFSCQTPKQDFFPLVTPRGEAANESGVIPAFARGDTVGGLRFSYNYAIVCSQFWAEEADDLGINQVMDQIDIRSGLVVLPLKGDQLFEPAADAIPSNIFRTNGTSPDQGGSGYFRPRILYRSLNQLRWYGSEVSGGVFLTGTGDRWAEYSSPQFNTTAGQEGTYPVTVKAKVALGMDEGLFWVVETNFGFAGGEGSTSSIAYGMNFFGVAAVKQSRTRPS